MKIARHLITGEPILVAPERATRPHAFGPDDTSELCPFCAGNESLTPPEVARVEREGAWLARAFPNKYPAAEANAAASRAIRGGVNGVPTICECRCSSDAPAVGPWFLKRQTDSDCAASAR